jgi:elongation factor Tu
MRTQEHVTMEKFFREKPRVSLCTVGDAGRGKTTLSLALKNVLAKYYGGTQVTKAELEQVKIPGTDGVRLQYDTPSRTYLHTDVSGSTEQVRSIIASAAPVTGAILVVSPTDRWTQQMIEHIQLCRDSGVQDIVVFMNKCDMVDDEQLLVLTEMEIREQLSEKEYPGDDLPVVRGSALKALEGEAQYEQKIVELTLHLDTYLRLP